MNNIQVLSLGSGKWSGLQVNDFDHLLDDAAGTKIEVVLDDLHELRGGLGTRPIVEDRHGERLRQPDGIGHLQWYITYCIWH